MKRLFTVLSLLLIASLSQAQILRDNFTYSDGTTLTGNKKWVAVTGITYGLVDSSGAVRSAGTVNDARGAQAWDSLMTAGTEVSISVARLGSFNGGTDAGVFAFMPGKTFATGQNGYVCRAPIGTWLRFGLQTGATEWGANTEYAISPALAVGDTLAFRIRSLSPFTVGLFRYRASGVRDSLGVYTNATYDLSAGFYSWIENGVDLAGTTALWDNYMAWPLGDPGTPTNSPPTISGLTHSPASPNKMTSDSLVTITLSASDAGTGAGLDSMKIYVDGVLAASKGALTTTTDALSTTPTKYAKGTHTYYGRVRDDSASVVLEPVAGTKTFTVDSSAIATPTVPIWMHWNPWGVGTKNGTANWLYGDQPSSNMVDYQLVDYTNFDYIILVGLGVSSGQLNWSSSMSLTARAPFNTYAHSKGKPVLITYGGAGSTSAAFSTTLTTYGVDSMVARFLRGVDTYGYDGISWDFEPFSGVDTTVIGPFLKKMADSLHARTSAYTGVGYKIMHFSGASNQSGVKYIIDNSTALRMDVIRGQFMDMTYDLAQSLGFGDIRVWHNNAPYGPAGSIWSTGWTSGIARLYRWNYSWNGYSKRSMWAPGIDFNGQEFVGGKSATDPTRGANVPTDAFVPGFNPTMKGDYYGYNMYQDYGIDTVVANKHWDDDAKASYISILVPATGPTPWMDDKFLSYTDSAGVFAWLKLVKDSTLGAIGVWDLDEGYLPATIQGRTITDRDRNFKWVKQARDFYFGSDTTTRSITSLSPSTKVAGAGAFTLTVNGTNFKTNDSVFIGGTHRVTTLVSATQVTVAAQAADIATAGTVSVYLKNGANTSNTSSLTVTAAATYPVITTASPASFGQGATNVSMTLGGSNFASDITLIAISGVTVGSVTRNSTSSATVVFSVSSVATVGNRDIIVHNVSDNLKDTLVNGLAITAKPTFTSITPSSQIQGTAQSVSIVGTGFTAGSLLTITASGANVTFSNITRASATTLTASVQVDASAATGARTLTITNGDGGLVTAASAYTVAAIPADTIAGGSVMTYDQNLRKFVLSGSTNYNQVKDVSPTDVSLPLSGKVNLGDDFAKYSDGTVKPFVQYIGIDGGPLSNDTTVLKSSDASITLATSNDTIDITTPAADSLHYGTVKLAGVLGGTADAPTIRDGTVSYDALTGTISSSKLPVNVVSAPPGEGFFPISTGDGTYSWTDTTGLKSGGSVPTGKIVIDSLNTNTDNDTLTKGLSFTDTLKFYSGANLMGQLYSGTTAVVLSGGVYSSTGVMLNDPNGGSYLRISPADTGSLYITGAGTTNKRFILRSRLSQTTEEKKFFQIKDSTGNSVFEVSNLGSMGMGNRTAGANSFTTTATADTVVITGTTTTDLFFITLTGTAAPSANDMITAQAKTDTLIVIRSSSGTSGLTYNWLRIRDLP